MCAASGAHIFYSEEYTMKIRICSVLLALFMSLSAACAAQAEFVLPASLTTIKTSAFEGDAAIRQVALPDTLHTIESKAFAASGLQEITFPESLETIAPDAFDNCGHIEAHAFGDTGRALIESLAANGCDIAWADEILSEISTHSLRAAKGQTIKRTFTAPLTGRYTFSATGSDTVIVSRYQPDGSTASESEHLLSLNLAEGASVPLGFRFADSTVSGSFSLSVTRTDNPMAALVCTPSLWVTRNNEPLRSAGTDGSLNQLALGEVLAPTLTLQNNGNRKLAGQFFVSLDGQEIDMGYFALASQESATLHVPADAAYAAETAGSHTAAYSVKLAEAEDVASMTWEITGARPAVTDAAIVKAGSNTVELSQADGNLFKFTPSKTGVYQIYTAASNCDTYAALRDSQTGRELVSDDDSGSPYQNFVFSYNLKAGTPVYIDMGMKNYKGSVDMSLEIDYCGTPSLRYSPSLYVFDGYSWADADNGNLNGTGMIKLKGKADLSTLTSEEYLTPVLVITNSSSKSMPLGLFAMLDGEPIYWSGDCEIAGGGKFTAYLYSTAGRMYETPGTHTIDYYVNGKLATSYTWEVTGRRAPQIYSSSPTLSLGSSYRRVDDTEGSFDRFVAPYSGVYHFYSTRDAMDLCGYLFDEDMNLIAYNDDNGDSKAFSIYQYLEAGQTVYLQAMLFDYGSDTATICADFVSTEPVPSLSLGLGETPMGMNAGDIFMASFTAPYTGEFRFVGEGETSTYGITASLYDTDWQDLGVSSTGYTAYFNLKYAMQEGETIYLKANCSKTDLSTILKVTGIAQ